MSGLMDTLGAALGGNVQEQLGDQIGADPQATGAAIQAALPMLVSGLVRNVSRPGGAESLLGALQRDHDGSVLDRLPGLLGGGLGASSGDQATNGAGIMGHVLGDQRDVAHQAVAQASGLNTGQAAQLMMALAPIVMGALGRVQRESGLDANGLASALKGEHATMAQAQPGIMQLATQLFDRNHDGSPLDDVMRGFGGMLGKR